MALWTDPSRQFLIQSIRNRHVLWDKNFTGDQNYRAVKSNAFIEITNELNSMFPMPTKFSCEDVRSQWKNLKDTFVRKLRWVTEGKYSEDPTKEPTWKFYRMLCFLDDKEAKRLGGDGNCQTTDQDGYEMVIHRADPQIMHMKTEVTHSLHYDHSNHSATSSEEQMLQMFAQNYEKPPQPPQPPVQSISPPSPSLPMPVSSAPCSTETICAKPSYSPPPNQVVIGNSHQHHHNTDDDDEPRRKRPYHRRQGMMSSSSGGSQDEFDLFGACVAAQLKRLCDEHSRSAALRLQKRLSDLMFDGQIALLEH